MIIEILLLLLLAYLYLKWNYGYWKRLGLEYIEPHLLYGNTKEFITRELSFGDQFCKLYNEFKSRGLKHGGVFVLTRPTYVPIDLGIVKHILQKDFTSFMNHGMFFNEKVDPLTGHLFNLEDEKWRKLRVKLTPVFTSGKMKMMFSTMVECTEGLVDILKENAKIKDVVDIKEVASRFTTDVIGSVAFGIECNTLKNPNSEFREFANRIFELNGWRRIRAFISNLVPRPVLIKLGFKQTRDDVEEFFMGVVKSTAEYREKNNVYRKDFMHLLLQLKNRGRVVDDEKVIVEGEEVKDGHYLTINEVAAQCFVFFIAGFETSATTMSFALLELASNPEIQTKLRDEINTVLEKHDGKITYDAVMEMTYLDKIIHETLRKHPPVPGGPRVCNKTYTIPGTNITLEEGTRVHIPFQAIQRDPDHYPEPDKFDPERFSEENKAKRHPLSFLTFGEGPRICIGARVGMLQAKVGLISIIQNFKVNVNKNTKLPIHYTTRAFVTAVDGGIWLDVNCLD